MQPDLDRIITDLEAALVTQEQMKADLTAAYGYIAALEADADAALLHQMAWAAGEIRDIAQRLPPGSPERIALWVVWSKLAIGPSVPRRQEFIGKAGEELGV